MGVIKVEIIAVNYEELIKALHSVIPKKDRYNVIFVCIGSDRATGDCLGPLVGYYLQLLGYDVVGTIYDPLHAQNIFDKINNIPRYKTVIAIDAALGDKEHLYTYLVRSGPLHPGLGVGKHLTPIGNYSIMGMVNINEGSEDDFFKNLIIQTTRLGIVWKMANDILQAIVNVFPISKTELMEVI